MGKDKKIKNRFTLGRDHTETLRVCPYCKGVVVWAMCIAGCEYVCFTCEEGFPLWNDLDKIDMPEGTSGKVRFENYNTYTRLAFTVGEATCRKCNSRYGNNCEYCSWEEVQ